VRRCPPPLPRPRFRLPVTRRRPHRATSTQLPGCAAACSAVPAALRYASATGRSTAGGGPGEYTRMFGPQSLPQSPAPVPAPAPAAFPSPAGATSRAPKKSALPLILILAGLFLVAVIVVVVFALKK